MSKPFRLALILTALGGVAAIVSLGENVTIFDVLIGAGFWFVLGYGIGWLIWVRSSGGAPKSTAPAGGRAATIAQLKALHDEGILTAEEYSAKVQRVTLETGGSTEPPPSGRGGRPARSLVAVVVILAAAGASVVYVTSMRNSESASSSDPPAPRPSEATTTTTTPQPVRTTAPPPPPTLPPSTTRPARATPPGSWPYFRLLYDDAAVAQAVAWWSGIGPLQQRTECIGWTGTTDDGYFSGWQLTLGQQMAPEAFRFVWALIDLLYVECGP